MPPILAKFMPSFNHRHMTLKHLIEFKIIETDKLTLTVYQILVFTFVLLVTWLVLKLMKKIINRRSLKHGINTGNYYIIIKIIRYTVWILAIGIGLDTIGIKLNLLIASSAALLVGIGLGLQQIFQDYLSGIIIMFEGIIKVNDVIQVGDLIGEVKFIGLRTSKIETRDDFVIVIPNHKMVNDMLINWSHNRTLTRFSVNVGVAYGSDVRLVEKVLLDCTREHKDISNAPAAFVRFNDFGNSSLGFQLYFWTEKAFRVENIKSNLRFLIDDKFRENNIKIPFPQRDVHMIKPD